MQKPTSESLAPGVLGGLRVVELGEGVGGPFCARLFADYGADVLKVEPRGTGDASRGWGPFPQDAPDPEKSGTFAFLNSGKRSVQLDLDSVEDMYASFKGWLIKLRDELMSAIAADSAVESAATEAASGGSASTRPPASRRHARRRPL